MAEEVRLARTSVRNAKKYEEKNRIRVKEELQARAKQIAEILKKNKSDRTTEEDEVLQQSPDVVADVERRAQHRIKVKERLKEIEDSAEDLESKCDKLANAIRQARHLVIYTGAGISTAASIPDYRGPNGVWTLLQQGKEIKAQDLSDADPTVTHMSIAKLYDENLVKYVVSQNCDGLHLRSGLPRNVLSEVHGNMYIEKCSSCTTNREYIRLFDVTERTAVRKHKTGRFCPTCGNELKDTIVHFGEKGGLDSPYNWQLAVDQVEECDMVLCLGTSLKVLRKYPCLWNMHKSPGKRPKLCIVNLQWTPKDDMATIKINGKCDEVMHLVMGKLGYSTPVYQRENDPIFLMATTLKPEEINSLSKKVLPVPTGLQAKMVFIGKLKEKLEDGEKDMANSSDLENLETSPLLDKSEKEMNPLSATKWDKENSRRDPAVKEENGSKFDVLRNMLTQPPKILNTVLPGCKPDVFSAPRGKNKNPFFFPEGQLHTSSIAWHLARPSLHSHSFINTAAIMQDHQYSTTASKMPHLASMLQANHLISMQNFYGKTNNFEMDPVSNVARSPGYDVMFNQVHSGTFQGYCSDSIISTNTTEYHKEPDYLSNIPMPVLDNYKERQRCAQNGTINESGRSSTATSDALRASLAAPDYMLATAKSYLCPPNLYATTSDYPSLCTNPQYGSGSQAIAKQSCQVSEEISHPLLSPHVFNNTSSSRKVQCRGNAEGSNVSVEEPQLQPLDLSKTTGALNSERTQLSTVVMASQESDVLSLDQDVDTDLYTKSQASGAGTLSASCSEKGEASSLKRTISVAAPGWFGKGLNVRKIKKRRLT